MPNRRSEVEIVQDAKTNCALDLLSNPHYAINLSLQRKLGKKVGKPKDEENYSMTLAMTIGPFDTTFIHCGYQL